MKIQSTIIVDWILYVQETQWDTTIVMLNIFLKSRFHYVKWSVRNQQPLVVFNDTEKFDDF